MEETMKNFLDELLEEVESKEKSERLAYYDLAIKEIAELEIEIAGIFSQSDRETAIIKEWALKKAATHQERIEMLMRKLECFLREEEKKTISLPHGTLKVRKLPDKIDVSNMEIFLKNAAGELLSVIPEQAKPDLSKIKTFIKMSGKIPDGVTVIEGKEQFSLKINQEVFHDTAK